MFFLLEVENEENVLVCLRIIIDLHKQFRPSFSTEVHTHTHIRTHTHTHTHTHAHTYTYTHTHTHILEGDKESVATDQPAIFFFP